MKPPRIMVAATREDIAWIAEMTTTNNYLGGRAATPGSWAAIMPLMWTGAIIVGKIGEDMQYNNRWCYTSIDVALAALNEWEKRGFEGEPIGWHRHPDTGRRRPEGNPAEEYINR